MLTLRITRLELKMILFFMQVIGIVHEMRLDSHHLKLKKLRDLGEGKLTLLRRGPTYIKGRPSCT